MNKALEDMTLEQLEYTQQAINKERAQLKHQAMAVQHVIDQKTVEAEARRKYEAMSEPERAALHQLISSNGVHSAEAMGTPGA